MVIHKIKNADSPLKASKPSSIKTITLTLGVLAFTYYATKVTKNSASNKFFLTLLYCFSH